jgi:hypothetical protein
MILGEASPAATLASKAASSFKTARWSHQIEGLEAR